MTLPVRDPTNPLSCQYLVSEVSLVGMLSCSLSVTCKEMTGPQLEFARCPPDTSIWLLIVKNFFCLMSTYIIPIISLNIHLTGQRGTLPFLEVPFLCVVYTSLMSPTQLANYRALNRLSKPL